MATDVFNRAVRHADSARCDNIAEDCRSTEFLLKSDIFDDAVP